MTLSAKVKKSINIGWRFLIAFASLWFIYKQITNPETLASFGDSLRVRWNTSDFLIPATIALVLMPVNWSIEALKWRLLIRYSENVSFTDSLKSVLTGISVSLFTPNRIGEFAGRILTLKKTHPLKAAFLSLTGSVSQLISTLLMGLFALIFFLPQKLDILAEANSWIYFLLIVAIVSCQLLIIMLYLKVPAITRLFPVKAEPKWAKLKSFTKIVNRLKRALLIQILWLSIVRYFIFTTQFYLLLIAFGIVMPWYTAFVLIAMTYFTMTAIPTIALIDLGIRGSVAMYFISSGTMQPDAPIAILAASTSIWILNLATPAIIGMFFINRLRIFRA